MGEAKGELLIKVDDGLVKMVRVDDGQVTDIAVESQADDSRASGQIYLGFVERVVSHLQAAFINIGEERDGFLGNREAKVLAEVADQNTKQDIKIEDCVAAGDTVLVQVTRPASGGKGASVTANITLPGRYLVLVPCSNRIAVSRSIEDEAERTRLIELTQKICEALDVEGLDGSAGWVLRTAAEGISEKALRHDMESVVQSWDDVLKRADDNEPPCVLYQDLGGLEKLLRDHIRTDIGRIIMGDKALGVQAKSYMDETMSDKGTLLEVLEGEDVFERYDIHQIIERACAARIDISTGAWLIIEDTQAMTTIDVNSGSHDASAFEINLVAAREIARQIRLRAIGGLIAIDFIDMLPKTDTAPILDALHEGFNSDKVPVRIGEMSDFGVVEMTRKRDRLPLKKALGLFL